MKDRSFIIVLLGALLASVFVGVAWLVTFLIGHDAVGVFAAAFILAAAVNLVLSAVLKVKSHMRKSAANG